MTNVVLYLRLERPSTGSWITLKLDKPIEFEAAEEWIEANMPGWELCMGSPDNPDEKD